jgi:hypothetical protein
MRKEKMKRIFKAISLMVESLKREKIGIFRRFLMLVGNGSLKFEMNTFLCLKF